MCILAISLNLSRFIRRQTYTSKDSIITLDFKTKEILEYSKSDVKKIVIIDKHEGRKVGALYGAIGGAVLVLILPYNPDDNILNPGRKAFMIIYSLLGAIGGAKSGFAHGYKEIYVFDVPQLNNISADNTR